MTTEDIATGDRQKLDDLRNYLQEKNTEFQAGNYASWLGALNRLLHPVKYQGYDAAVRKPVVEYEDLAALAMRAVGAPGRDNQEVDELIIELVKAIRYLIEDRRSGAMTTANRELLYRIRDIEERYNPRGVRRAQNGKLTFKDARAVLAALPEIRRALDAAWSNLGAVLADRKQLHEHFDRAVSDNNRMRDALTAKTRETEALHNSARAAIIKLEKLRSKVDAASEIDSIIRGLRAQLPK